MSLFYLRNEWSLTQACLNILARTQTDTRTKKKHTFTLLPLQHTHKPQDSSLADASASMQLSKEAQQYGAMSIDGALSWRSVVALPAHINISSSQAEGGASVISEHDSSSSKSSSKGRPRSSHKKESQGSSSRRLPASASLSQLQWTVSGQVCWYETE